MVRYVRGWKGPYVEAQRAVHHAETSNRYETMKVAQMLPVLASSGHRSYQELPLQLGIQLIVKVRYCVIEYPFYKTKT